jgi:hypothetical protein
VESHRDAYAVFPHAGVTDTQIKRHAVFVNSTFSLAAPSPALSQARFNWRRMNFQAVGGGAGGPAASRRG